MKFSPTFSLYTIRNLMLNIFYVFIIFALIVFIMEFVELIRESQGKKILFARLIEMALLKTPFLTLSFISFIFLFGSILAFTKLNNNYELVIAKSSGISNLSLCIPISIVMITFSLFIVFIFQPVSAICLDYNRILGIKHLGYHAKRVSLQSNGIWLFENSNLSEENKIFFIKNIDKDRVLHNIRIYIAGSDDNFTTSYFAESANLGNNYIDLNNATIFKPDVLPTKEKNLRISTNLVEDQLQLSIPNPDIIPFWDLKNFITRIKESGFSSLKHELYYMNMLFSPLLHLSLVLIALALSTNLPRKGKMGKVFVSAACLGLIIFYAEKITNILALTGIFPVFIAAAAPGFIFLLLSIIALIHLEEY